MNQSLTSVVLLVGIIVAVGLVTRHILTVSARAASDRLRSGATQHPWHR